MIGPPVTISLAPAFQYFVNRPLPDLWILVCEHTWQNSLRVSPADISLNRWSYNMLHELWLSP